MAVGKLRRNIYSTELTKILPRCDGVQKAEESLCKKGEPLVTPRTAQPRTPPLPPCPGGA